MDRRVKPFGLRLRANGYGLHGAGRAALSGGALIEVPYFTLARKRRYGDVMRRVDCRR